MVCSATTLQLLVLMVPYMLRPDSPPSSVGPRFVVTNGELFPTRLQREQGGKQRTWPDPLTPNSHSKPFPLRLRRSFRGIIVNAHETTKSQSVKKRKKVTNSIQKKEPDGVVCFSLRHSPSFLSPPFC